MPTQHFIDGPVGKLELTIDFPDETPRGIALISHPQPLLGGTPRHLVPTALARRLRRAGWIAVRPSFRGVDGSEGGHDAGVGEAEDIVLIVQTLRQSHPGLPLALVGFSFGAYVFARVACALQETAAVDAVVLLGLPVGWVPAGRKYPAQSVPDRTLLIHGSSDDVAPFTNLVDWASLEYRPILVMPGANHFFKGCLDKVAELIEAHLAGLVTPQDGVKESVDCWKCLCLSAR